MPLDDFRNAILASWKPSQTAEAHNYIDILEKKYCHDGSVGSVKRATVTLALDNNVHGNEQGRTIRFYVYLWFVEQFPAGDWRNDFMNFTDVNGIPGFDIEQRTLQGNAVASGNAIHAILRDQNWQEWTEKDLKDNLQKLRVCCATLASWTDAYVASTKKCK